VFLDIIYFFQILISTIFLFSFGSKVLTFNQFKSVFSSLGFTKVFPQLFAVFILICEFSVSLLIVFKSTYLYGEIMLLFLILSFLFTTIYSQYKKLKIKCNCFGGFADENLGKSTYIRILFLSILLCILTLSNIKVGIEDIALNTTINLILSSVNILFLYFLINSFITMFLIRRGT
jgi:hypothetical protein